MSSFSLPLIFNFVSPHPIVAFFSCREIFSYLDRVDSSSDKALINAKGSSSSSLIERGGGDANVELEFALEPDVIEDVPK